MYAQTIVNERLYAAKQELGWSPDYHSVEEIVLFNKQTDRLYTFDGSGNKVFDWSGLTNDEKHFIINEQVLMMCDAAYGLTRYMFVKREDGVLGRFTFRIPQKIMFEIISELEDKRSSIEIILLKSRQLGMSTLVELLLCQRVPFMRGINAVIASSSRPQSNKMSKMLFRAFDLLPEWMKPKVTRRVESDQGMLEFGAIDSGISIQHGNQVTGIARGDTPQVYHLSEVAGFTDPVNQIEASIFRAVHASTNVFGVLESTAEGDTGWWSEKWKDAKDKYPKGRSRLCPKFLPWFCGTDLYPNQAWLRKFPVPGGFRPNKDTQQHVARAELYAQTEPSLRLHLGTPDLWGKQIQMPIEQQWFWEFGHEEAKRTGTVSKWYQEMCGDDVEAFQHSYESVFGRDVIEIVDQQRERKYEVFGIVGECVEEKFEPDPEEIDYDRDRIPISFKSHKGEVYRWEMVPLKYGHGWTMTDEEEQDIDPNNKLFIFNHPEPGVDYSLGIDTSNGIGSDYTCMSMLARGGKDVPDRQVAEFRSQYVSHVEAYAFALCFAAHYSRHMVETTRYREPYVSVEQIAAVGDTCQFQMKRMGYSRFHTFVRFDGKTVRKSQAKRQGWYTNSWSRPFITDNFVVAVQNGWCIINSPWTIEEMKHWEVHYTAGGKQKKEHAAEYTDDGIFSNGMAYFCPNDLNLLADRSKRRFSPIDFTQLPPLDIRPYGTTVNSGQVVVSDKRYNGDLEEWQ